ncbi:MAG: biotin synthase BioB [Candidatus Omnitrophica bacterium]|nr:biotin synthase BioB [Candidatus Omnitrophota bacterium]
MDMPLDEAASAALRAGREHGSLRFEACAIVNAKSGRCCEDCKFCAQSAFHSTGISEYPLKTPEEIFAEALRAKENGASRFGIVTSGNRLTRKELAEISIAIKRISGTLGLRVCASLGALSAEELDGLKASGLSRYHHNIESSPSYYPKIVSTHTFQERLSTIKTAKAAGLEVCSGGIIGLGETWEDRLDMAMTLDGLNVDAVPLNFLIPVKGTLMEGAPSIGKEDALRTISLFRLVMPARDIKIIAGRETVFREDQERIFRAGANGIMVGGYLTTGGQSFEEDMVLSEAARSIWTMG